MYIRSISADVLAMAEMGDSSQYQTAVSLVVTFTKFLHSVGAWFNWVGKVVQR